MPKFSLASLLDQLSLACQGLFLLATKKPYRAYFWLSFVLLFLFFGTLLNLLANGLSSFRLLFSGSVSLSFSILSSAFLGIFGVNKALPDWLLNLALTLLQSVLLSLVIFLARQPNPKNSASPKKSSASLKKSSAVTETSSPSQPSQKSDPHPDASSALESSALVTGLVVLGSGCPTCGTTLLAPLLTTLASGASGSLALAGALSFVFNFLAFLLGIFAFRRLGLTTYATIKSHQPNRKKKK